MFPLEELLGPLWPLVGPLLGPLLPQGAIVTVEAARQAARAVAVGLPLVAAGGLLAGFAGRLVLARPSVAALVATLLGALLAVWGFSVWAGSPLGPYSVIPWAVALVVAVAGFAAASLVARARRGP